MENIILDTDIGTDVDDAVALLLAARSPEIDLASVTTVSSRTEVRARLARRLLELADRASVPVAAGVTHSLASARFGEFFPEGIWFGHEGRGVLTEDEIASAPDADGEAAIAQITRALAAEPHTVVTIGPLGNVAVALERDPSIVRNISRIVIMGGCLHTPKLGGVEMPPFAEFNLNADREAAYRVLFSGVPVTLVPVELTLRTYLTDADVVILRSAGDAAANALADLIDEWTPIFRQMTAAIASEASPLNTWVCHLHDPLALLAVIQPALVAFRDFRIDVREEDGVLRTRPTDDGGVIVRVAVDTDPEAVRCFVMDRVTNRG